MVKRLYGIEKIVGPNPIGSTKPIVDFQRMLVLEFLLMARVARTEQCTAVINGVQGAMIPCRDGEGYCMGDIFGAKGRIRSIKSGECIANIDQARISGRQLEPIFTYEPAIQPFSLDSGLSPLNAYFALPVEDRRFMLAALSTASKWLPTAADCFAARHRSRAELEIEHMYGDVADGYA